MAPGKTINVDLGTKQASLQRHLDSGHYENASEVLQDALEALDERSVVDDAWLREEVNTSMADKRSGVPIDVAFKRVRARIARSTNAAKRGT